MLPADDARLVRLLDQRLADAARLGGESLVCRPGCTPCCIGPFPVTALDAARLREGLAALAREDPARAARVAARARAAAAVLREGDPDEPGCEWLADDDAAQEAFLARHAALPCPALDPEAGTCELYAHRPVSCRTFGPPVRLGAEDLPPCALCFVGVPAAEVERCRIEPDPEGLEDAILRPMPDGNRETLIAFALARAEV